LSPPAASTGFAFQGFIPKTWLKRKKLSETGRPGK
jgi:hypothetical protein